LSSIKLQVLGQLTKKKLPKLILDVVTGVQTPTHLLACAMILVISYQSKK